MECFFSSRTTSQTASSCQCWNLRGSRGDAGPKLSRVLAHFDLILPPRRCSGTDGPWHRIPFLDSPWRAASCRESHTVLWNSLDGEQEHAEVLQGFDNMGLLLVRNGGSFPLTLRLVREMCEPVNECTLCLGELCGEMYGCLDLLVSWGKLAFFRTGELSDHQTPCQDFQPHQALRGRCGTDVHSSDGVDFEASRGR